MNMYNIFKYILRHLGNQKSSLGGGLVGILLLFTLPSFSQGVANTAFQSGEILTYNLYFNWKFVWIKAGNASLSTIMTRYKGQNAYKSSLTAKTNERADKFYTIRDNITVYCSGNLVPMYYCKNAHEGDRRSVDEAWYDFKGNTCNLRVNRRKNGGSNRAKNITTSNSFDMLSIFLRARSWDTSGWKNGHKVAFHLVEGKGISPAYIRYEGKTTVSGDNGKKYNCLKLSYYENGKGKGYKRIATFYVTNDANHIPVLIDLNLKFGSAKAKISNIRGNRYPLK